MFYFLYKLLFNAYYAKRKFFVQNSEKNAAKIRHLEV
jgi:hypothetical protein